MAAIWRAHINTVKVQFQKLFIVRKDQRVRRAVFALCLFRALNDQIAERDKVYPAQRFQRRHMLSVGDPAAANNAGLQDFHFLRSFGSFGADIMYDLIVMA